MLSFSTEYHIFLSQGYLRKFNPEEGIVHTTINFTKDLNLLEKMEYCGYHEDGKEQSVGWVNEEKIIKTGGNDIGKSVPHPMERPMTGKGLVG